MGADLSEGPVILVALETNLLDARADSQMRVPPSVVDRMAGQTGDIARFMDATHPLRAGVFLVALEAETIQRRG